MTSALDAAVLASLYPIFFAVASVFVLKEKVTKQEQIGLGIALAGTLVFTLQPLLSKQEVGQSSFIGNIIIIIAQFFYIAAMIVSKKTVTKNPPFVQSYFAWLCAFLIFTPLAFLTNTVKLDQFFTIVNNPAFPNIIYMAIFGSIIAFFAYIYGQSKIEVSEAAVFTYLQPFG